MKNLRLLVSLLFVMSLRPNDAPGQRSPAGDGDAGPLRGQWTLTRLTVEGTEHPLNASVTTLGFGPGDAMEGRAAINDYQGQYAADAAGRLRWPTPTRSTRRGGPAESLRLESTYLYALSLATRWEILSAGSELRLSTADGKTVLLFRRQPASP